MRICMLAPVDSIHTRRWVETLAAEGHEMTYLNVSGHGREFRDVTTVSVDGGAEFASSIRRLWRKRALIRDLRPDIVHQHAVPSSPANFAFWRTPRLVVSSWGTDVVGDNGRRSFTAEVWQRFLLAQATAVTATSQFLARETAKLAPRNPNISVIPFGVDCEVFSRERYRHVRAEDGVTIGFVKHLETRYGPEQLLRAFASLARRHQNSRLVIIGEGSLRARLKQLAKELGVTDRVSLPGAIAHEDVPLVLAQINIFVMPSVCQESFGVAALEASAMEIPVVATRVGGIPEAALDAETGLLVPPNDVNALEDAIERLIKARNLREKLGRQGRTWVLSRYTWEKGVSDMQELYNEVCSGGSR